MEQFVTRNYKLNAINNADFLSIEFRDRAAAADFRAHLES
jgi:hypothetical protein